MRLSLNWLKEFVDIPTDISPQRLGELLTVRMCEVEKFECEANAFKNMVVGKIVEVNSHPNADKLRVCTVDVGGKNATIVCGGENVKPNLLVAVAMPGSMVRWHGQGDLIELKDAEIRGVASFGMICAEEEIGLPVMTPQKGITIADIGYICKKLKLPEPTAGTPLASAINKDDVIFEVDNKSITHRPDLWGHYGMAREFSAFLGKKLKPLKFNNIFPQSGESVKVELAQSEISARFMSAIITGIKVGPSPLWIQQRLTACGMRPVNNIVDITNYVMLELGHPLHAFDRRVIGNDSFVIRFAKDGEVIETLDHKKRTLTSADALVTNGQTALALAGIMGGLNSEITADTTEIVLEVACWNPVMVRKTSQRQNLRSEAASRFEKSLDPEYTGFAFDRAVQLILKYCRGSTLSGPATDIYSMRPQLPSILLNTEKANRMIGTNLSEKEISGYLKALQFGVQKESKGVLRVTVPSWRATKDISIEEDLVEEIARAHGYENLEPHAVSLPIKAPIVDKERQAMQRARAILALALGFNETLTYSFYGERELEEFLIKNSPLESTHYQVQNPLSLDQTHLRISLIPNLAKAAARNSVNNDIVKLFEIGRTYIKNSPVIEKSFMPKEDRYCAAIAITKSSDAFDEMLGAVKTFLEEMKLPNVVFMSEQDLNIADSRQTTEPNGHDHLPYSFAHPNAYSWIFSGDDCIGQIYDLNPLVAKNLDLPRDASAAAFELNFSKLIAIGEEPFVYKPMPKFPGIEIDVAVLVDSKTKIGEVGDVLFAAQAIKPITEQTIGSVSKIGDELLAPHSAESAPQNAEKLIQNVSFVESFNDESVVGVGKKSLTMRVLLQSPHRTLTDDDMKAVQQAIFDAIEKNGWKVR